MEMASSEKGSENVPLITQRSTSGQFNLTGSLTRQNSLSNRNSMRTSALQSAIQVSQRSKILLIFQTIYLSIKIIACLYIIFSNTQNTDKPLESFIWIMVSVDLIYILKTLHGIFSSENNEPTSLKLTLDRLERLALAGYLVGHIFGNVWFYTCPACSEQAPDLTDATLVLIILGYIYVSLPCLTCCCICMCLPVIIGVMIYLQPRQHPASEAAINKLQTIQFFDFEEENKECTICFCAYKENEEILKLKCDENHTFHPECLKKWLRINNACPICRSAID
ncbi:hypothetical protein SteCoe_7637 [Stentor coeruleus]|uniref:RING-type domain-containing protein n=1 Tax=Stentor coeruleus TaxID=5963 RepID=A0A1R2CM15_9CILI|nr:hypothetical protein SteCoe_7637 [Stentor coeruleus]